MAIDLEKLKKELLDHIDSLTDEELLQELIECGLQLEESESMEKDCFNCKNEKTEICIHCYHPRKYGDKVYDADAATQWEPKEGE